MAGPDPTLLALIASNPFFARISAEAREAIARAMMPVTLHSGIVVFARGEPGDFLLLIGEGRIRLSITSEEGRELSVRLAGPGEIIGELAVLDASPRSADATALGEVRAFRLDRAHLFTLGETYPELLAGIIRFLCRRLRETTDQLEGIALHSIEQRLARFLLVALDGKTAPPGKRIPIEIGFSQTELAQLLGASRPKVNVALGSLEQVGAVKRTADRMFCDPELLAGIAGTEHG